jgi:hypothetical protein
MQLMAERQSGLTIAAERRAYGWGVATAPIDAGIFFSRDISFAVNTDGTRDLALVDGFAALEQDLLVALGTALGGDPLNITFGFDGIRAIADETDPLMLRERLRGAIIALLRADHRVLDVTRVLIGDEVAAFRAGATIAPPPVGSYGMLTIEVSFRVVGGDATTLTFGPMLAGA